LPHHVLSGMDPTRNNHRLPGWPFGFALAFSLGLVGTALYQALLKSVAVRTLAQWLDNPAKSRGIWVDLGPGIPGWLRLTLTGFMSHTLPGVLGHPMEAVAFSRFGGFNLDRRFSDFLNPHSPSYQCWYGAYIVFDNEHRQRFGFEPDGGASVGDALDALEADQRLVYKSAGVPLKHDDGRVVRPKTEFDRVQVEEDGVTWWKVSGAAETWSTYRRGRLPDESWKARWCYGSVPADADHGVDDLHPLTYSGEFRVRYEEAWRASCCKFFIYPSYADRTGREIDKGDARLMKAGQAALSGIRFGRAERRIPHTPNPF
jgi:hypothetical protein